MKVIVHHCGNHLLGSNYSCPSWDTVYEFPDYLSYMFPTYYFTEKEWEQFNKERKEEREKEEKLEELKRNQQERNYCLDTFYAILLILSIFLLPIIIIKII